MTAMHAQTLTSPSFN